MARSKRPSALSAMAGRSTLVFAAAAAAAWFFVPASALAATTDAESIAPLIGWADRFATAIPAWAATSVADAWRGAEAWVGRNFARAPALMAGLVALLVLPVLALLGYVLRRLTRAGRATSVPQRPHAYSDGLTWPVDAWIEIDGQRETRRPIVHDMVRIGCEPDNEFVIPAGSAHRYHAVIRRTEDAEILITDLSPPDGYGLSVNEARIGEARLRHGDIITLGETRLRFIARPSGR